MLTVVIKTLFSLQDCNVLLQVGFVILYIVDNGRSIVSQALRVSSKHQGKGIASLLIDRGKNLS